MAGVDAVTNDWRAPHWLAEGLDEDGYIPEARESYPHIVRFYQYMTPVRRRPAPEPGYGPWLFYEMDASRYTIPVRYPPIDETGAILGADGAPGRSVRFRSEVDAVFFKLRWLG